MLIDGDGATSALRGYQRKTNRLPYPHITEEFPGKIDTTTAYVMARLFRVWRWTADGPWHVPCGRLLPTATRLKKSSKLGYAVLSMLARDRTSGGRAKIYAKMTHS